VQRDSDEEAWRAIVANYGDRVELDEEPPSEPPVEPSVEPSVEPRREPSDDQRLERLFRALPDPQAQPRDRSEGDDDDFVPPAPPPLPKLPPDRLMAWSGLFGSPTVLLVCLVVGVHLAPWLGYLLVAAFIGGFAYLVAQMPRGPADPWDDGARL
jgi:hypothetical protein